ncbi:uncharacterized protein PGTG_15202 [Puccinia graminis f. sp. tritici CRL 75-36-700-3]|uniref:Uncharacterized protein n=1 Tax=Puccinia graminis f. sp. tritici (strain CRL 75-36-700-3 / race SCCL) TaxID=418459 RepID=E3KXC6_PUCGT|nr:uncharacterized protein PGTG_15202 [Puccinia graminis f. sp. tritici CRL 75-36-700-3]EFP88999.1 hypothetical protein PGTG_15202 [Puccinia graminis f. sp. tritici CRL 75-36-700-3]
MKNKFVTSLFRRAAVTQDPKNCPRPRVHIDLIVYRQDLAPQLSIGTNGKGSIPNTKLRTDPLLLTCLYPVHQQPAFILTPPPNPLPLIRSLKIQLSYPFNRIRTHFGRLQSPTHHLASPPQTYTATWIRTHLLPDFQFYSSPST